MAVIAQIAVDVVANTGKLDKGLNKSSRNVDGFANKLSGIGNKIAAAFSNPAIAVAAAGAVAFTAAMAAAAFAAKKLTDEIQQQFQEIDKLNKSAGKLGLSFNAFVGIDLAARRGGIATEQLTRGIEKLQRNIGDAARGLTSTQRSFEFLGLSVDRLRRLAPEDQFREVAAAISKIPGQADRMAASIAVFGRTGGDVLHIISETAAGFDGMVKRAEKFGLTLSQVDAKNVEAMNDALADTRDIFAGLARQLAANVAPVVTVVAEDLNELLTGPTRDSALAASLDTINRSLVFSAAVLDSIASDVEQIGTLSERMFEMSALKRKLDMLQQINDALKNIGINIPAAVDDSGAIKSALESQGFPGQVASVVFEASQKAFGPQIDGPTIGPVDDSPFTNSLNRFQQRIEERRQEIANALKLPNLDVGDAPIRALELRNNIDSVATGLRGQIDGLRMSADALQLHTLRTQGAGNEALRFIAHLQQQRNALEQFQKTQQKSQAVLETLRKQIDTYGMSARQIQFYELAQAGATKADLAAAAAMSRKLDALDKSKEMADRGKALAESLQTPLERYRAALADIDKLQRFGAISKNTALRAIDARKKELEGLLKQPEPARGPVTAKLQGSQEAFDAIARFEAGDRKNVDQKKLDFMARQAKELAAIRENTKRPALAALPVLESIN